MLIFTEVINRFSTMGLLFWVGFQILKMPKTAEPLPLMAA